jgi:hypothetical protein
MKSIIKYEKYNCYKNYKHHSFYYDNYQEGHMHSKKHSFGFQYKEHDYYSKRYTYYYYFNHKELYK